MMAARGAASMKLVGPPCTELFRGTDSRTAGRTDDGKFNSPPSSLREAGDNRKFSSDSNGTPRTPRTPKKDQINI